MRVSPILALLPCEHPGTPGMHAVETAHTLC